jgi:nucleobase:cation symporter-1, NCS1 family
MVFFRAYAAYIAGILINVVGFAGATGRDVPLAATRIYQMSFFTGFGVSALIYYILSRFWQPAGYADQFTEMDVSAAEEVLVTASRSKDDDTDKRSSTDKVPV